MGLKRGSNSSDEFPNSQPNDHFKLPSEVFSCGDASSLKSILRSLIHEAVEEAMNKLVLPRLQLLQVPDLPSTSRLAFHETESFVSRRLHLRFIGDYPHTLFTLTKISETCDGELLQVELCDDSGKRVEEGDESSAKIKIFVLPGDFEVEDRDDWTEDELNSKVVKQREGKPPLIVGNCCISMSKGIALLDDIKFTDNSCWIRNKKFKLGAQIIKGLPAGVVARVAISEAFKVKEHRTLSLQKLEKPSLEDYVWRLDNISKTGPIRLRLAEENINTLKDFLQLYHTDAKKLQKILGLNAKKWQKIVKKAELCELSTEVYTYWDEKEQVELLLDCVFKILRVTLKDQPILIYEQLDDSQKELVNKLRITAYENRSKLEKTCVPSNQKISGQVESGFSSCNTHKSMHYLNVGANVTQNEQHKSDIPMLAESCTSSFMNTNMLSCYDSSALGKQISTYNPTRAQTEMGCPPIVQYADADPSIIQGNKYTGESSLSFDDFDLDEFERLMLEFGSSLNQTQGYKMLRNVCIFIKAVAIFRIVGRQNHTHPRKKQKSC